MVIVALAVRLVVMAFTYTLQLDPARDHFAFGFEMGRIARSIASGQGFSSPYPEPSGPTALVAPVYPYLLAGVFRLFGIYTTASALVILSLNNLFAALTCLPVFFVARKTFGSDTARWAGWAWAFFPYSIGLGNVWIWETSLTTLLLSLLLLATLQLIRSTRLIAWVGYGLLWGLTALTSPAVLSVAPFLWLWIWYRQRRRGTKCGHLVVVTALIFLASVAPWMMRNYQTFDRFVLFRSGFGQEFMVGNIEGLSTPESETILPADNPAEMEKISRLGEPAYMAEKQQEASELFARHPGHVVLMTVRRIVYSWTGIWGLHPSWRPDEEYGVPNIFVYTAISILAFLGLGRGIRDRREYIVPFAILLTFFPLVYYITHADVRYRHPIDPAIAILAVYGGIGLIRRLSRRVYTESS